MRISDWSSDVCSSDLLRPLAQPRHPAQLVIEFRPRLWIAIGKIDRRDAQAVDVGFQIARLLILRFARKPALHLDGLRAFREDRDTVAALLSVIEKAVTRRPDPLRRHLHVARLPSLQTGDKGLGFLEPHAEAPPRGHDPYDI